MKKIIAFVLLLLLAAPPVYCADKRYVQGYPRTATNDNNQTVLAPGDYTVIAPAANGKSIGFWLLGVIPFLFATRSRAVNNLYENINVNGKATSLANVYQAKDSH